MARGNAPIRKTGNEETLKLIEVARNWSFVTRKEKRMTKKESIGKAKSDSCIE
jgi:hypothetical protein